jgi:glycosyltransferase involved in cell wall biosynthesis
MSSNHPNIEFTVQKKMNKLCLNMIVKNESKIIIRLLSSIWELIDGYCICDTGSTDNTKELITQFFEEKGIPGKVIEEPFRDFGYNRSFALTACESMPDMDYILLLDADMVLEGSALNFPKEFKEQLTLDYYHMFQGNPTYYYKNVRIVKNFAGFSYWGVTHEYVNSPPNSVVGNIERDILFISDIGDGGAKSDKIDRDIRLLEKGLVDSPNNDRYTYYLANSYRDGQRYEDAVRTYRKRIEIGGWIEEIWQSYYCIGKCYMEMSKNMDEPKKTEYEQNAIFAWLDGYNAYPRRIENLHKIIEHYRTRGKNMLAYQVYKIADKSRTQWKEWSDYLFLERDVYDYKIDYEFSIIFYYVRELAISEGFCPKAISMHVLNDPHSHNVHNNVMSNYKFYTDGIVQVQAWVC